MARRRTGERQPRKRTGMLSEKEIAFAQHIAQDGNATKAAIEVLGINPGGYAALAGHRMMKRADIIEAVAQAKMTIAEALPNSLLAEKHLEGLEATKVLDESGAEAPDYAIRHKYLDTAYKIKGAYAAEKVDMRVEDVTDVSDRIRQLAEKLRELER